MIWRPQNGFTYLGLLFVVALMGIALAATGSLWVVERQREREQELLFVGDQIRKAIGGYYERSPGLIKRYPPSLDELLKDARFLGIQRHLRRPYHDPMTDGEWGLILAPEGGVMGVYSKANGVPIKQSGFTDINSEFVSSPSYAKWRFVYRSR